MRTNGTLRLETITDEIENEYGEYEEGSSNWSQPIPCFIQTNSDNRKGKYEDGEFRMASFTILVELTTLPRLEHNKVRLERRDGYIGEFSVLSFEPFSSMGRMRIMV